MTAVPAPRSHPHPVGVAVVMAVIATLPAFLTGALGVELGRDLGVSIGQLGVAVSAYFFLSAMLSTPLGGVGDRFGPAAVLRIGAALMAVSMAAIALLADSFATLLACLTAGGIGHSLIQPALNGLLARRVSPSHLGLAFGIKQSAIPIAVLLSGVSVPAIALTVGWRGAFVAGAVFAVIPAFVIERLVPPNVAEQPRSGRPDMRRGLLVTFGVAAGLAAMGGNALAVFLVSAAVATGIAQGSAGLLLAAGSLVAVLVRVTAGALVDRGASDGLLPFAALAVGGSVGLLGLMSSEPWLFVAAALVSFGGAWGWPGLFNFAVVAHNSNAPSAASGVTQTAVSLGASAGPLLFGIIAGSSYDAAFAVMAGLGIAGGLLAEAARRRLGPATPSRPPGRMLPRVRPADSV
jgi:MFS family permease